MGQFLQWIFLAGLGMLLLVLAGIFLDMMVGLVYRIVKETTNF